MQERIGENMTDSCKLCNHQKEEHPENGEGMNPCKKCGCPEYNLVGGD